MDCRRCDKCLKQERLHLCRLNDSMRLQERNNSMTGKKKQDVIDEFHLLRTKIEALKSDVHRKVHITVTGVSPLWLGELRANLLLSVRYLEDAKIRLGMAIKALNGGASHYTKIDEEGAQRACNRKTAEIAVAARGAQRPTS